MKNRRKPLRNSFSVVWALGGDKCTSSFFSRFDFSRAELRAPSTYKIEWILRNVCWCIVMLQLVIRLIVIIVDHMRGTESLSIISFVQMPRWRRSPVLVNVDVARGTVNSLLTRPTRYCCFAWRCNMRDVTSGDCNAHRRSHCISFLLNRSPVEPIASRTDR